MNWARIDSRSHGGVDFFQGGLIGLARSLALGVCGAAQEKASAAAPYEHRTAALLARGLDFDRFQVRRRRRFTGTSLLGELFLEVVRNLSGAAALGIIQTAEERRRRPRRTAIAPALGARDLNLDSRDGAPLVVDRQCVTAFGIARAAQKRSARS